MITIPSVDDADRGAPSFGSRAQLMALIRPLSKNSEMVRICFPASFVCGLNRVVGGFSRAAQPAQRSGRTGDANSGTPFGSGGRLASPGSPGSEGPALRLHTGRSFTRGRRIGALRRKRQPPDDDDRRLIARVDMAAREL